MKKIVLIVFCLFYNKNSTAQVNFTSSNLPMIVIDTKGKNIVDEPKIIAEMGIIFNGEGKLNNLSDPYNSFNGDIGIEIRGSSSQQFPKKQYGFETWDSSRADLDVSLLGFPKESDWILSAPYSDKSLLRNVLTYKISNDLGRYASRTKYCELVLNGQYMGIYILMEKIKRDKNRVNIKKLEPQDISGDNLTGGYIFKIDKQEGTVLGGWNSLAWYYNNSIRQVYYQYDYPSGNDLTSEQIDYIQSFMLEFETVLYGNDYDIPFNGYYDFIDIDSFIDYYIVNEISKNVDAYRLSTFLYKNRDSEGGKINLGPVWDFNLAFGNAEYDDGWKTEGWQVFIDNVSIWRTPYWAMKLMDNSIFKNKFAKRWLELRKNVLSNNYLASFIDSTITDFKQARIRNFDKWKVIGKYVWPNKFIGNTYEEEIDFLKTWLNNRINWIDNNVLQQYSSIDWTDAKNIESIEKLSFSIADFYKNAENVDSVKFYVNTNPEDLIVKNDSIFINSASEYEIILRGIAWRKNQKIDFSPKYLVKKGITNIEENQQSIDSKYSLAQNYPNPFNPKTVVSYTLAEAGNVKILIYDVVGKEKKVLLNKYQDSGNYKIEFDASMFSSGVYFYRLIVNDLIETKKMMLVK